LASPARAAYIHVPFCRRRCGYCNFTVVAARDELIPAYLQALEIELSSLEYPREVDSLFVGGGTPTQLAPPQLRQLGALIRRWFPPALHCEFTVEANPSDVTPEKLDALTDVGITRISLGVQSFDNAKLAVLHRDHRREQALSAIQDCRQAFASVAVDLIFSAPGETLNGWHEDLDAVIAAPVDHVSTYGLTYEKGAAFWAQRQRGELRAADEEQERAMFEAAIDRLTAAGLEHYEVSNFARSGHRCRQNETYWRGDEYFAAGPGAARYVDGWRETNHRSTSTWLKRVLSGRSPVAERERLAPAAAARERLVFQLRMLQGVDRREFEQQTGYTVDQLVGDLLPGLVRLGLLEDHAGRLRLSREGLMISDSLWPEFLE
jgi:oxygen-independent coproporphyrinogen-3 oxidase